LRVTSAVDNTGSSHARSACGTKVIVFSASARPILGAAMAAAPASVDFRKLRRFIGISSGYRVNPSGICTIPAELAALVINADPAA